MKQILWKIVLLIGIVTVMAGFFSPWIQHKTAGLSITGFEMAEWIKFAPEVQSGDSGLARTLFYLPPLVCAVGLAALAASFDHSQPVLKWLLLLLVLFTSLLPFPLLEEIKSIAGIKVNIGRLSLIAIGLCAGLVALLIRNLPAWFWSLFVIVIAAAGFIGIFSAFSTAEPIVERLYNHLIDPGMGYRLDQIGIIFILLGGIGRLFDTKRRCSS